MQRARRALITATSSAQARPWFIAGIDGVDAGGSLLYAFSNPT